MTKVFLHYKEQPDVSSEWTNEERTFARLPCVGEYVALNEDGPWYRVYLVVHCPFDAGIDAEVFTVRGPTQTEAVAAHKPLPAD